MARSGEAQPEDRDLLLKVSGFSPLGWGSRGIALGADLPHAEWEKRINHALETFDSSPTIMQRFHKGSLFDHQYWDPGSNELKTIKGRVRLCPVPFRRTGSCKTSRLTRNDRARRQKVSARHERRGSGAIEDPVISDNAQLKACKRDAFASKKSHEHHQKPRNAAARHLPDSRRNYSAAPHHHPDHRNGNPGTGSGYFDSHWQIATSLLVFTASL